VLRRWHRQHERRPPTAASAATETHPPALLSSFELLTTTFTSCFVEEHYEEDLRLARADLDAPEGTPLPRRRLFRADRPFSLAAAIGANNAAGRPAAAPTTITPHAWPSVAAYTRKGYLRGDPNFKPQNQDRAFMVAVASSSSSNNDGNGNNNDSPTPTPPLLLIGVCDGHGSDGHHVSGWLARDFPRLLAERLLEEEGGRSDDRTAPAKRRPTPLPLPFGRSSVPTPRDDPDDSNSTTALVRPLPAPSAPELARWRLAFDDGDRLLPQRCVGGRDSVIDSGSTLCAVCVRSGGDQTAELVAGWVGDSRAAVGGWRPPPPRLSSSRAALSSLIPAASAASTAEATATLSAFATPLTDDHKPEREDERARVLLFGGRVEPMGFGPPPGVYAGPFRVWCPGRRDYPGLAMSRAFGDLGARPAGVVSEPELRRWRLTTATTTTTGGRAADASSASSAQFAVRPLLLVASDGVFEYMDNDEALGAAAAGAERAAARGASRDEAAAAACRAVVDAAERRWRRDGSGGGYCDDITAVVALWG
jgi:serine/threonine protein phosphatase PrpC